MATKNPARTATNRTGVLMSPQHAKLMQDAEGLPPSDPGADVGAASRVRRSYIAEADALGSMPSSGSAKAAKGAAKAGAQENAGKHPQVLIDKLAERTAFERGGARLYDALIDKFLAWEDRLDAFSVQDLTHIRAEEVEHFHLLVECIETLGADPTSQTPAADLVGIETMGILQAITEPRTTFAQSLHAILGAELIDREGWEMLIALARSAGQKDMAERFEQALSQEEEHLAIVRTWYQQLVLEPRSAH